jgi:hypothetical protein
MCSVAEHLLMGEDHGDLSHPNFFEPALETPKEEEGTLCLRVLSVPMAAKIAMHEYLLCIAEDVAVPIWPGWLFGQVKHCYEEFLKRPQELKSVAGIVGNRLKLGLDVRITRWEELLEDAEKCPTHSPIAAYAEAAKA